MIVTKPSNQIKTKHEDTKQYGHSNSNVLPQSDDIFAGLNLPSAPNHPIVVNRSITSVSTTNVPLLVSPLLSQSSDEVEPQSQFPITQSDSVLSDESKGVSISLVQFDDVSSSNILFISDVDVIASSSSKPTTFIADPFASSPIISSTILDPISNLPSTTSSSSVVLSADLSKLYITTENHQKSQMVYPELPTLYASQSSSSSQPLTSYQPTLNDINTANVEPSSRTQQSSPSVIDVTSTINHQQSIDANSAAESLRSPTGVPDTALVNDLISENTKLSQELENLRQALKIQQEQGVTDTYSLRPPPAVATNNNNQQQQQRQQRTPIIGHVVNYPLPTNNTIVVNNSMNRNIFNTSAVSATNNNHHHTNPIRIHANINSYTVSNTSSTSHSFVIPLAVTSSSSLSSSSSDNNNSSTGSASSYNQNTPNGSSTNNSCNNTMNGQYAALPSVEDDCDNYDTVENRTLSNNSNSTGYHPTVMMSESDRISLINNTNFYTNNSSGINTNNYTQQEPSQFSQMSRTSSTTNPATTSNMIATNANISTRAAVNTSAIKYVCCGTCHQWLTAPLTSNYVYCPSCESINQCNQVPLRPANSPVYLEHQQQNATVTNQNVPWLLVPLYDCIRGMFM